jgi:Cys-rich four helix bundle protein (predicted Tat secretion target)
VIVGLTAAAATLLATRVDAQTKPPVAADPHAAPGAAPATKPKAAGDKPAPAPAAALPPAFAAGLQAIVESTSNCLRDGRVCLARCTDHLAAGAGHMHMDQCQRAVMNMLAVTAAMADVAGYRNADPKQIVALASACAAFCRTCAAACEPHKDHHVECKACRESCLTCAQACEALSA